MRQWFTMQASSTEIETAEILIYDEIGKSFWGEATVDAKTFIDSLAALGDVANIKLRINSPGGDVFDGLAIHNALKNHKAKVTAHVDGLAASIASYIAMAADKIIMPSNAFMLIHQAAGFVMGNADDMRAVADDLDRVDKSIVATYAARSSATKAKIMAIMKEDRLMDAAEAKELGLVDEVTKEVKMAAKFSLRLLPPAAAEKFRAETGTHHGDPPPVVEPVTPEEPLNSSTAPPVSSEPTAEVIDLDVAKQQGIDEHKAYVTSVTDLCVLAGAPERVGAYVRAGASVDEVRKELLEIKASQPDVLPQHPLAVHAPNAPKASIEAWGKITDKLNARLKK